MTNLCKQTRRNLKSTMALLLAIMTLFGALPLNVYANTTPEAEVPPEPITVNIFGEEHELGVDGVVQLDMRHAGIDEPLDFIVPRYVWLDGERISIGDERIVNFVPILTPEDAMPMSAFSVDGLFEPLSDTSIPPLSGISPMSQTINNADRATMTFQGRTGPVSAARYIVHLTNGLELEGFCADPSLPGPMQANTVYVPKDDMINDVQLNRVLRYGFPSNPYLSDMSLPETTRIRNAYVTRLAVAMANPRNAGATFTAGTSEGQSMIADAQGLMNGTWPAASMRNFDETRPAIALALPGQTPMRNASDTGRLIDENLEYATSLPFTVSFNRRTNLPTNPYFFVWSQNTPAGTRLLMNGELIHTKSDSHNSEVVLPGGDTIGWPNEPSVTFQIEMPNPYENEGEVSAIELVGAGVIWGDMQGDNNRVWMLQHPTNPTGYQDILYTFPNVRSRAEFSFQLDWTQPTPSPQPSPQPTPSPPPGSGGSNGGTSVTIQKINAVTGAQVPGAVMRLRGLGGTTTVTTGDGQTWSSTNEGIQIDHVMTSGTWTTPTLPYGFYIVEEIQAPENFSMLPGPFVQAFIVVPPDVTVTAEGIPVISTDSGSITTSGEDFSSTTTWHYETVEHIDIIYEITLIPNTTNVNLIFRNYPFGEITVNKFCNVTNTPLAGAHFRIEGFFPEPGRDGIVIDRTGITGADGSFTFTNLPSGQYTITEIQAPPGFRLDDPAFRSVSIPWGGSGSVSFYNTPMGYLQIVKVDGDSGATLAGARFTLEGPDQNGVRTTWTAVSGTNGVAQFEGPFIPGETYVITEVEPPAGYVLSDGPTHHVMSYGTNRIYWENWANPGLTIVKVDQDTQQPLAGAVFEVTAQGTGSPLPTDFELVTGADGRIHIPWTLFEGEPERTFIITEIVPPPGYHLADPNWQVVTMLAGHDNTVTFQNRRRPTTTIQKRDARTGDPIEGAEFTVYKITQPGSGYLTGNPFRTGPDGRIVLPELHAGRYRIVETRPAQGYWLAPLEQRSWIIEVRPNEDYLLIAENILLPTLVITKWNMLTMRPVPMTHFLVEFEIPNTGAVERVGHFITDHNGQIILPLVPSGWYRITETHPAPGMALNQNNSYRQFLSPGDNTYLILDYIRNDIGLRVLESDRDVPQTQSPPTRGPDLDLDSIPQQDVGASFPFTPEEWEAMNYSARQQFLRSQVSITDGNQWLAPGGNNVFNWPLNSIVIKKTCSVTGQLLQGATFTLTHTSAGTSGTLGTVIGTYTTGPSGIIVITGLVPGSYVVTETSPPDNFTLSLNNTQTAFLAPDGHTVVELNFHNDPYGSLLVHKRCDVTGEPLQNAEFRVTRSDGTVVGTANGLFRTNQQGYFLIPNLPPDTYVVVETRAPSGFRINPMPQTVMVGATGRTYQLYFTNTPYSTLIIRKFDDYDGSPLQGARFEVRNVDGSLIATDLVTNADGIIEVHDVLGWLVVQELEAPSGFALDPDPTRTVNVRAHAPEVVTFRNPRLGSLTIEKTDRFGAPLAGARFLVRRQNGENVGEHVTGPAGFINLSNLSPGWYTVEEIAAPLGFVISKAGRSVEVRNNSVAVAHFTNYEYPTLTILKVDSGGNPLPGARFTVAQIGGSFRRENLTTGQAGIYSLNLPVSQGVFEIIETHAPAGYVITEPARTISVRAGEHHTETFVNHRRPDLVIEKVCPDGLPLAGAEFEIRTLTGAFVRRVTTQSGGFAPVPDLDPGTYMVVETRAPQGFVRDSNSQLVTVVAGDVVELRFVNERIPSLRIEKVDGDGQPLSGAEFEVRELNGALVARVESQNGVAVVPQIAPGFYMVVETRAPDGYEIVTVPRFVEIRAGDTSVLRFVNLRTPSLVIEKIDTEGNPLANAEFEVRTLAGALVERVVTNSAGVATIARIDPGIYQVLETRAPAGFVLNSVGQIIEVVPGQSATIRFVNARIPSLIIEKLDINRLPLAGAIFEVRTLAGALVAELETNAGGIAVVELPPGQYEIIETHAPDGFVRESNSRVIDIVADQSLTVRFTNHTEPVLTIEKVDETGLPLSGAVFELRTLTGTLIREVTTNNGGIAIITGLEPGSFELRETRPPTGFEIIERSRVFEMVSGESRTERFVNYRTPSLIIEKIDTEGNPLANAEFEVRRLDGGLVTRITTDSSGIAIVANIEPGIYHVLESRPPAGFVMDSIGQIVELVPGQTATLRFVNARTPSLIIEKLDINRLPLAGAIFEVRTLAGALVAELETNAGGIAVVELPPGQYEIIETHAPDGFVRESNSRVIDIVADQSLTVRFTNHTEPVLTIEKVDESGLPLSGAVFELRTLTGTLIREVTTNNGGIAIIEGLEPGSFELRETRAPAGFEIIERSRVFEMVSGESRNERFVNYRTPSLIIEKIDTEGNPLANAEFEVRRLDGGLVTRITTDSSGIAIVANIDPGIYHVLESRPPAGFVMDSIGQIVELVPGQTATLRFVNARTPSLIIEKLDINRLPLAGAIFEVRTLAGALVAELETNAGGIAVVELPPGQYEIIETHAPDGFVRESNSRVIDIVADQSLTVRVTNHTEPVLTIEKVDETGLPLSGAVFELRTLTGTLIREVTTNNGGIAIITGLNPGSFELTETRAPEGFVITERSRVFEIVSGESRTERFVNYRQPSIVIEKVDRDGNPLSGAEFEVRRLNGELITRGVTNQGGVFIVVGLEPSAYEIEETRAPDGFVITEPSRVVEVIAGQTRTERFINFRVPSLIIEKVCENGEPLAGAEFEIRRMNGELVHRLVTHNGGLAIVEELAPGAYEIIETRPPDGFAVVEPSRAIQIVAGETRTERFVNPRLATFVINKISGITGNPLQGVVFEITTLEGEHIRNPVNGSFEFETDSSGLVRLPQLPAGSYVATETRPLPGYRAAQPVVFLVGHDRDYIVTIRNYPYPDYNIRKLDGHTELPMQGVQFEIATFFANGSIGERIRNPVDGSFVWTTDQAGLIRIPNLPHGTYVATETVTLPGFRLHEPVIFVVDDHYPTTLTVRNYRYSEWNIRKFSGETGEPLEGVVFEVAHFFGTGTTGDRIRNSLDGSFEFVTDAAGLTRIGSLVPGTYIITETRALPGYIAAEPVIITVEAGAEDTTVTFRNYTRPYFVVRKLSGDTGEPLQGVIFELAEFFGTNAHGNRIRNPVDGSFEFVTDAAGLIRLPQLETGTTYVLTETRALPGYTAAQPHVFTVGDNIDSTITIRNYKQPSVVIRKLDGHTGRPQAGVEFEIAVYLDNGRTGQNLKNYADGGSYTFVTDASGHIYLPTLPDGRYIVTETRPLPGFRAAAPVIFTVGVNGDHTVIIRNYRYADFAVLKVDGDTREPLAGVEFEIAHYLGGGRNGDRLINPADRTTTFVTDASGMIHLPNIAPGMYVAIETRALPGFSLAHPQTFTVGGDDRVITIHNYRVADWVIRKTDGDTGQALAGVEFEIARYFGSGQSGERLQNPVDGGFSFVTDTAGLIRLPNLDPGTYIATETRALPGYILAAPVIFVVNPDAQNTTVDVLNFRQPNLTIRKISSVTRQPIEGVVFELARINGERVINPQTGFFDFVTDRNGLIHLPALENGTYLVTETRPAQGYFGLDEAVLVEINADTRRQDHLLVIENTPAAGLLIIKTDTNTGQPLQGVEFEVRHADGRLVRNAITDGNQAGTIANSPQLSANGNFLTDARGRIQLNHLEPGVYHVTELNALPGYILDTTVHTVTVNAGLLTTLEVTNTQMAGLRLYKVDSVTGYGIFGVEFRIFDFITNQEVAGPFITDNEGVIDFTGILPPGRYTIRESREAPGYIRDTMPRTIEFRAGMITEVIWENTREAGQLQITKISSAANEMTGLPAGTRLEGAVFEVRDWRTGNVIDQFVTAANGVGVSRPLPLGRYTVHEIIAPPFHRRSDVTLDITIEHSGQIIRYEFTNEPANVGVEIRKTGPQEVMANQPIVWQVPIIANSSNIELTDFFWRDQLPGHAVRLDRIFTGIFNQSVRYSVLFRTNTNGEWRIAYDNLSSVQNNALVMSPAALGLAPNEFVTEVMFNFGVVRAGFRNTEAPRIEGTVRDGLQNGYEFVNRVEAGGRSGSEWVIGNGLWTTRVFRPGGRHPQTGF